MKIETVIHAYIISHVTLEVQDEVVNMTESSHLDNFIVTATPPQERLTRCDEGEGKGLETPQAGGTAVPINIKSNLMEVIKMANQELRQGRLPGSDLEHQEVIPTPKPSPESEETKKKLVTPRSKNPADPRNAKKLSTPKTPTPGGTQPEEPVTTNPSEADSAKPKSQQSDKKKADAEEKKKAKAQQKADAKKQAEADKKAAEEQKAKEDKMAVDGFAIEINRCMTHAKRYEDQAESFYFEMGKWLSEAKGKIKKMKEVKWLTWLEDNFNMTERTAQIRMKTYNAFVDNPQALSTLGYTKASVLATLTSDKREAFLSDQKHEVKDGVFKTVKEMSTRELEKLVQECKEQKPRSVQQKVSVEGFSKKLSSLGTQLDDVVSSLSKIDGDPATYKELYTKLNELLSGSVSKLSDQPSELMPSDEPPADSKPNPSKDGKVA